MNTRVASCLHATVEIRALSLGPWKSYRHTIESIQKAKKEMLTGCSSFQLIYCRKTDKIASHTKENAFSEISSSTSVSVHHA
jgi:hypothetical protein